MYLKQKMTGGLLITQDRIKLNYELDCKDMLPIVEEKAEHDVKIECTDNVKPTMTCFDLSGNELSTVSFYFVRGFIEWIESDQCVPGVTSTLCKSRSDSGCVKKANAFCLYRYC